MLLATSGLCPCRAEDQAYGAGPPEKLSGKVAYVALVDGYWQIWVHDLKAGTCAQMTHSAYDKRTPTWDLAGKVLIYRTTAGILERLDLAEGKTTPLAPTLGYLVEPRRSPSGRRLAFGRFESDPPDNTDLYIYNLEDQSLLKLTKSPELEYAPAWSPDEKLIAYVGGRGRRCHPLRIMNADGANQRVLQKDPADDCAPAFSPDGQWIVFSSNRTDDYELWRIRPDGKDLQRLTHAAGLDASPSFAPDGAHIVFASNRQGRQDLWVMTAEGKDQRCLLKDARAMRDPAWWQPMKEPVKDRSK